MLSYQFRLMDHRYHLLQLETRTYESDFFACEAAKHMNVGRVVEISRQGQFILRIEADGSTSRE